MAGNKNPKRRPAARSRAVTARPKALSAEVTASPVVDPGLSVDADDLGVHFLTEATQQANFESMRAQPPELSIMEGAPSDDPLVGPNFDPDHSLWEQTVDLTLESSEEVAPLDLENDAGRGRVARRDVKRSDR